MPFEIEPKALTIKGLFLTHYASGNANNPSSASLFANGVMSARLFVEYAYQSDIASKTATREEILSAIKVHFTNGGYLDVYSTTQPDTPLNRPGTGWHFSLEDNGFLHDLNPMPKEEQKLPDREETDLIESTFVMYVTPPVSQPNLTHTLFVRYTPEGASRASIDSPTVSLSTTSIEMTKDKFEFCYVDGINEGTAGQQHDFTNLFALRYTEDAGMYPAVVREIVVMEPFFLVKNGKGKGYQPNMSITYLWDNKKVASLYYKATQTSGKVVTERTDPLLPAQQGGKYTTLYPGLESHWYETKGKGWKWSTGLASASIQRAFELGIPAIGHQSDDLSSITETWSNGRIDLQFDESDKSIQVQDNCGNVIKLFISWGKKEWADHSTNPWEITSAVLVVPEAN